MEHDPSVIASTLKAKIYVNDLYIGPGKPTTVKIFVGHNKPAAMFNSIELVKIVDEIECTVKVCAIRSNKVVVAGYRNGSTKTLEPENFTYIVGTLPRMKKLDVEVKNMNITDLTADPTQRPDPRNRVKAAHILCAAKDEKAVNTSLSHTYCKTRKAS